MDARALYKSAQFFLIAFILIWFFLLPDAYFSWHGGAIGLQGLYLPGAGVGGILLLPLK
jgi:hypothetical protein